MDKYGAYFCSEAKSKPSCLKNLIDKRQLSFCFFYVTLNASVKFVVMILLL